MTSTLSRIKWFVIPAILGLPVFVQAKTLTYNGQTWTVDVKFDQYANQPYVRNDFSLLQLARATTQDQPLTESVLMLDPATLQSVAQIAQAVNQPSENAQMQIANNQVTQFNPGQNGQSVDLNQLLTELTLPLQSSMLPVVVAEPKITLGDTNDLGIRDLIAVGESNFAGSPANRIHNIMVGAQKFNGVIVPPGQEFSFDDTLGPVDNAHGYLPELVIDGNSVVPEDGGGLCQVSTTAFRAAMNAGLPITDRRNHSFAVSYYAPQGTDATIYPGSADLKFINNLSSSLLITTQIVGKKLYFYYYGTKDDRQVSFEGPTVYDRKPDGSLKATWIRHVTLAGTTTTQTFNSTYLPPAQFGEAPPTPTTQ